MKMLGLNPMEQEIVDLTNNIVKNGLIYFPEFCKVIQKKFREDDEEAFRQNMFKVRPNFMIIYCWCLTSSYHPLRDWLYMGAVPEEPEYLYLVGMGGI